MESTVKKDNDIDKLDPRKPDELLSAFDLADNIITKRFLSLLSKFEIVKKTNDSDKLSSDGIRLLSVKKIVYNKNENNIQKLTNVYSTVAGMKSDIAIIIDSDGKNIDMYIGVVGSNTLYENSKTLHGSIKANFPGSLSNYDNDVVDVTATQRLLNDIFYNNTGAIASVSGIASIRNDQIDDNVNNIQGIEKMIDTMQGHKYTAIFIANHLSEERLDDIAAEYEMLYSKLAPFVKSDMSYNSSETDGVSQSIGESLTDTVGKNRSTSLSIGTNESTSHSVGNAETKTNTAGGSYTYTSGNSYTHGTSHTEGKSAGVKIDAKTVVNLAATGIGMVYPPAKAIIKTAGNVISNAVDGVNISKSVSDTVSESFTNSSSNSYSTNYSHSISRTNSITDTTTFGKSNTTTDTEGESTSTSIGKSTVNGKQHQDQKGRSLSISYENKAVSELLKKIDEQLERIKVCRSYGIFAAAAYFISDSMMVSQMAASSYKSLISGKSTYVEKSCINIWNDTNSYELISDYLRKLQHPIFNANDYFGLNVVTPASLVSGQELALQMSFPQNSITGVSVVESVAFGRNLFLLDDKGNNNKKINVGKIYHMGSEEEIDINLDVESLSMHTFITGSTGSGKSNTIYNMLDRLINQGIKFLIIEPAKGEYKNMFGNRRDVTVVGTNQMYSKLLKINPFKFPDKVHVLEHVDRLIEIFNVCWPMYAAMPAVLKDAVLQAYEVCGWDLVKSTNKYSKNLFPTFKDLQNELIDVIENSAYSQELKSNYIGSLATRIKSLTNGLNGQIFSSDEIDNNILFDSNVIVDLSRVGSLETKSLIMGILVMRLNEHRMSYTEGMNVQLKHVTVLEEAHNILKRTSTEQGMDTANVAGKSVEMLSNAIAEMRTYGEGFIIADQSPSAVDISAIRNTNTKIIMRLPDEADRRLAGKSAALKDEQLDEIAKLPKGVAVVYQNDWLEPVLCKVNKYEGKEEVYKFNGDTELNEDNKKVFISELLKLLLIGRNIEQTDINIDILYKYLDSIDISTKNKVILHYILKEYLNTGKLLLWDAENFSKLSEIVTELLECKTKVNNVINSVDNFEILTNELCRIIEEDTISLENNTKIAICQCLLKEYSKQDEDKERIYVAWRRNIENEVNIR